MFIKVSLTVLMIVISANSLPAIEPKPEPRQFFDFFEIFEALFDDEDEFEFENKNVTSNNFSH